MLAGANAVVERQGEHAAGDGFGDREPGRDGAGVGAPGGLQVDWGEIASGGYAAGCEHGLNAVAIDLQRKPNRINKPANCAGGECEGRMLEAGKADLLEECMVTLGGRAAQGEDLCDA